jgi:hypothetical protein
MEIQSENLEERDNLKDPDVDALAISKLLLY